MRGEHEFDLLRDGGPIDLFFRNASGDHAAERVHAGIDARRVVLTLCCANLLEPPKPHLVALLRDVGERQEKGKSTHDVPNAMRRDRFDDGVERLERWILLAVARFAQRLPLCADALHRLVHLGTCLRAEHLAQEIAQNTHVDSKRLVGLGGNAGARGFHAPYIGKNWDSARP